MLEHRSRKLIYNYTHLQGSALTISPDGRELAFGVNRDGCDFAVILDVLTGKTRELYSYPDCKVSQYTPIQWMPDGAHIIFTQQEEGESVFNPSSLWRIPSEGGAPKLLHKSSRRLEGLAVHPDGNRIAIHEVTTSEDVWVIKNLLPGN